jgi:hypothetical protein
MTIQAFYGLHIRVVTQHTRKGKSEKCSFTIGVSSSGDGSSPSPPSENEGGGGEMVKFTITVPDKAVSDLETSYTTQGARYQQVLEDLNGGFEDVDDGSEDLDHGLTEEDVGYGDVDDSFQVKKPKVYKDQFDGFRLHFPPTHSTHSKKLTPSSKSASRRELQGEHYLTNFLKRMDVKISDNGHYYKGRAEIGGYDQEKLIFNRELGGKQVTLESDPNEHARRYMSDVAKLIYTFSSAILKMIAAKKSGSIGEAEGKRARTEHEQETGAKRFGGESNPGRKKQPTSSDEESQERKDQTEPENQQPSNTMEFKF